MHEVQPVAGSPATALLGRSAECTALASLLDRAAAGGAGLLLTGDAGVGKTALLEWAGERASASGATVLRAAGVEFEAEVSHAGLHQLLLPLLDDLGDLPQPQREALLVALGLGTGAPPHRLLVSAAVLGLLVRAARARPLVAVVDDVPWLDRSSAQVLGFVARRVHGTRIGLLAAARSGSDCVLVEAGLPDMEVRPLDEPAAAQLLRRCFPGLGKQVRRRVLVASQGNPLALQQLPAAMTEGQRRGSVDLPAALTLGSQLQKVFARQLSELPSATRRLLLLAALDGTGDLRTLRAAAGDEHWLDDLAPAEQAQLVRVDIGAQQVRLRHPLIGSAVVELSTSSELRRAHGALAEALLDRPEECAWHLAEAVVGPDQRAADLLEVAALRARHKGDAVRAVHALLRSADLTPTGPARARRLAAAAFVGADTTGDLRTVPQLLSAARTADPGTTTPLEVAVAAAYHLLNGAGDVPTAHLVLVKAIEHALEPRTGAGAVEDALHSLMLVCHFDGGDEVWRPFERAFGLLEDDVPPLLALSRATFADPARATPTDLARLDEVVGGVHAAVDPTHVVRVGMAAFYADRLAACRPALRRVVDDGRSGGAAASAVNALMMLCHDAFDSGRWDEAGTMAGEGRAWGEELGYQLVTMPGIYCSALLAAARGDREGASDLCDQLTGWAAPRGARLLEVWAGRVRGLSALGHGEVEEAYRQFSGISRPGGFAAYAPVAVCVAMDLVEAAVRAGRHGEAAEHVAAMRRAAVFAGRPRLALLREGSAALVAPAEEASACFERALSVPGADRYPFEHARVRLAYGEHLRRSRAPSAARHQLTGARQTFEALGAAPWTARASTELAATGLPRHELPTVAALTAQEHQIALLAASGLSNKDIGRRLHLSPRTVGAHLYRTFPKLGITSRAALRDALNASAAGQGARTAQRAVL